MTDDLIERVARAIYLADEGLVSEEVDRYWNGWTKEARTALAIAFEEAARMADDDHDLTWGTPGTLGNSFRARAKEFEVKP